MGNATQICVLVGWLQQTFSDCVFDGSPRLESCLLVRVRSVDEVEVTGGGKGGEGG